jgi:hypothetical protein
MRDAPQGKCSEIERYRLSGQPHHKSFRTAM